jgi:hypothetical protein
MSKSAVKYVKRRKDHNGNCISKKTLSHGSYRCKRRPNSKRCQA